MRYAICLCLFACFHFHVVFGFVVTIIWWRERYNKYTCLWQEYDIIILSTKCFPTYASKTQCFCNKITRKYSTKQCHSGW